jgi:peptidyl-prolyl cis-trans isomerase C
MKIEIKMIFPAALAAVLLAATCVHAVTPPPAPASTNKSPAAATASTNASTVITTTNTSLEAAMTALFGNPVLAKGNGFEIKRSELDEAVSGVRAAAAMRGQTISPEQQILIEQQLLERLIDVRMLLTKAADADKAAGKAVADAQLATLLDRAGSETNLNQQLRAVGMTQAELRTKVTEEAIAQAVLKRELKIDVTEAEVKKFYEDHPADFEQPEMAHVRHILVSIVDTTTGNMMTADQQAAQRKQADGLLKRARDGEDFAALAKAFSGDPGSRDKGGELPAFPRGEMVPEFEATAFALTNNQISDVITTQFGYHIIKMIEKIPAKKVTLTDKAPMSDKTVAERIKDYLIQQKIAEAGPAYLENLRKKSGVEILDPTLMPAPNPGGMAPSANSAAPAAPAAKK